MNKIVLSDEEIELVRFTVENKLVDFRNMCLSTIRNNGISIKNSDNSSSEIIRFGFEYGMILAIEAINKKREGN